MATKVPVKYVEDNFATIESYKQDHHQTTGQGEDGYGSKISMPYLVRLNKKGPWRRVYCVIFSNVGSLYIIVKGEKFFIRNDEYLRTTGVWETPLNTASQPKPLQKV